MTQGKQNSEYKNMESCRKGYCITECFLGKVTFHRDLKRVRK